MVQPNTEQPTTEWSPPSGYVSLQVADASSTIFDYDNIKSNPNLHLWAFRAPFNLTAKHLKDVILDFSIDPASPVLATITRKDKHYKVVPSVSVNSDPSPALPTVAAGELASLSCLLPRASKGGDKLVIAPKSIQRHFVVSLAEVKPDRPVIPLPTGSASRRPQPSDRLVHVFHPLGSRGVLPERADVSETASPDRSGQLMMPPKSPSKKRKASGDPGSLPSKQRKHLGGAS